MIKLFKKNRAFRLRAVRAYLLVILVCTLVIFCFTIISLYQQSQFRKISASNVPTPETVLGSDTEKPLKEEAIDQSQEVIPGIHLIISSESPIPSAIKNNRELLFAGFATVMLLCAMGIGIKLLIQVTWDIRWFQLRSDFVSGVSHEFKTPLSLIRLYSETLASTDQQFSAEDQSNYTRIIARESERMSRMLDNVLNFANMEQGRRRRELHEGDIGEAVTQIVNDYSDYLTWRGFFVRCSIWPHLPKVLFNPEQLSEMILNLLDNARKYSGKSREIRVNVWIQNHEIVVEVRDYGIGIPLNEQGKIFQPFYRLSRGKEQGGCGLGLYLVDQVMKEYGGRVEVESELDHGSRFRLIFPIPEHKKGKSWKRQGHKIAAAQLERQV